MPRRKHASPEEPRKPGARPPGPARNTDRLPNRAHGPSRCLRTGECRRTPEAADRRAGGEDRRVRKGLGRVRRGEEIGSAAAGLAARPGWLEKLQVELVGELNSELSTLGPADLG